MKNIIYDCDGILLDWNAGFRDFIRHCDGIELDPSGPCNYNMMEWLGTQDRAFVRDRVIRFNLDEGGYFENLAPVRGAVEGVERLRAVGYNDIVLTACNSGPETALKRIANLNRVFKGDFREIICIELGGSKRQILGGREKSWFIDDHIEHAESAVETGHRALLLEYPHNSVTGVDERFERLGNWGDIQNRIQGLDITAEP